jgi:Zn-dependent M28 family amino/carboxypeptidase
LKSFLLLLFAVSVASAQVDRIEGAKIRPHVQFLSSDLLEGRAPGTRGGQLAEQYIATQFALAGLKPGGDSGTYFQKVPMVMVEVLPGARLSASAAGNTIDFRWLDDFVGTSDLQQGSSTVDSQVIFVGHGINAPEFGWNDYAGVNVKGKVVLMFTNEPPSTDPAFFMGPALTYYGRWTYKFEEAARQGAAAAILIHTTPTASYGWQVLRANGRAIPQVVRRPSEPALAFAGWITEDAGNRILGLIGQNVASMLQKADTRGFTAMPLPVTVRGSMALKNSPFDASNVIGMVPGSGGPLAQEAVVYTAHWDHLGTGEAVNGDAIYNGAVDNATGTALLLEMARAWASLEPKPLRSAYFVAVTAEESGLLGSQYLAANPPVPSDKIAANLNFDSFSPYGRQTGIVVTGAERTSFFATVQNDAKRFQLEILPDPRPGAGSYYRSDHFSMAKTGIPAFSVNSAGDYVGKPAEFTAEKRKQGATTYHQPSDQYSPDWDFSGMEWIAKFGFTLGLDIANLPKIPERLR